MKLKTLLPLLLLYNFMFSQFFHDTQGKLEISNSGQATYTLPIALPASIQSVGPTINLFYSSGQVGGIAGQGWSINSISTISRMSTRKDIDGYVDGVDFDSDDKLALDGQRLLLYPGTGDYWADGSRYETEVQSNNKIELKGSGDSIYFIVTAPDGSRSYYGNYGGAHATDLTAYYLVRFEDTKGNFIIYNYDNLYAGSLCVTEILFSANIYGNSTPLNKIRFNYEAAVRKENAYIKGIKVEKTALLKNVIVYTNDLIFKRYELTHKIDESGYQRVYRIQEYNSAGEGANPVDFEYDTTNISLLSHPATNNNNYNYGNVQMTGDFDGDGKLDFIANNKLNLKMFENEGYEYTLPFTESKRLTFTATTLLNSKHHQAQSIVNVVESIDGIKFDVYSLNTGIISNIYSKNIVLDNQMNCVDNFTQFDYDDLTGEILTGPGHPVSKCNTPIKKDSNKYLEGDFNGDGLSEVLIFAYDQTKVYEVSSNSGSEPLTLVDSEDPQTGVIIQPNANCAWHNITSPHFIMASYLDLNPNSSINEGSSGNFIIQNYDLLQGDKRTVMDFNGDGKADIFVMNNDKTYKIIGFKQLLVSPWLELEIIGQGSIDDFSTNKNMYFGDFNGDGKTDMLFPEVEGDGCENTPNCSRWHFYFSNSNSVGGVYFVEVPQYITPYMPMFIYPNDSQIYVNQYLAIDTNKDGKTDLVRVQMRRYDNSNFFQQTNIDVDWNIYSYTNNFGNTSVGQNKFVLDYSSPTYKLDAGAIPSVIASNYKFNGLNSDFVLMQQFRANDVILYGRQIYFVEFTKNFNRDNSLIKVKQGGGAIVDTIEYSPMIGQMGKKGLYSYMNSLYYPKVEIGQIPSVRIVSKHSNTVLGLTKQQDFRYHGYTVNMNGLGVLGFLKTARSSWYSEESDKVTWTVTENDPNKRGATIRTYSKMLDISSEFEFNEYTNWISYVNYYYDTAPDILQMNRYILLLKGVETTDIITGVVSYKNNDIYTPDKFLLKKSTTTNWTIGGPIIGSTIVETTYDDDVLQDGNDYHIGRPNMIKTKVSAYSDTQVSYEKFFYINNNLKRTEKSKNSNPIILKEEFEYFPNGNVKSKTISATGTNSENEVNARTTSYTYDATNRFVKTTTDTNGLVSVNSIFDPIYGAVLKETNPLGLSTVSIYDNWGKPTRVTDFLGKSVNYTYTKNDAIYTTTETVDYGAEGISSSILDSDALGREIRKGTIDINGHWNYSSTEYDIYGRKYKVSEPYNENETPSLFTVYDYDEYSRPIKITAYTGKVTTIDYDGLTTTSSDGVLTKSTTKNANGHLISTKESPIGGIINYKYFADGNLKSSDYQGISVTMGYDDWGRKIYMNDTSTGVYAYKYDAFGQLKKETNNNGTTIYEYFDDGKLKTKHVFGVNDTDILSSYSYDTYGRPTAIDVTNTADGNSSYSYEYDLTTKQLFKSTEILPQAEFITELGFDDFGRTIKESKTAFAHGKTASKSIVNEYKNGFLFQIKDKATQQMLWRIDGANSSGQLTHAMLGNGISIDNTYDEYGFPKQFLHDKTIAGSTVNIMKLKTSFEPTKGNLESRYSSLFDINEFFKYDELDRLYHTNTIGATLTLVDATFNSDVEGFDYYGSTAGYIELNNSKLKVKAVSDYSGVKKILYANAPQGKSVHIEANVSKISGGSTVYAFLREIDTNTQQVINEENIGEVGNGLFSYDYMVSQNSNLYLNFEILNTSSGNGGSGGADPILVIDIDGNEVPITSYAIFTIDDLKATVIYEVDEDQQYDERGRITENSQIGTYEYNDINHPYQATAVNYLVEPNANDYFVANHDLNINYNAFKSPIQIEDKDIEKISFGYNYMEQRSVMYYGSNDADKMARSYRKYYSGDGSMEIKYVPATNGIEFLFYIGGNAYSAPLVAKSDGEYSKYYYLHRDYQSSILAITDEQGDIIEKRQFDAWGNVVGVKDAMNQDLLHMMFFDRGYTGHEHLQGIGLINMNARLYDPKVHRFLQADNFIQDPYNTQNYNRYSYCVNNPLKHTDITGNVFGIDDAIIIGLAISIASYLTSSAINHTPIKFYGIMTSVVIGTISSIATFGVGEITQGITPLFLKTSFQALAHGSIQGGLSSIQGGNFWTGFSSGSLSSLGASGWQASAGRFGSSGVGTMVFGSISGGVGAELSGGNFWQGAVTGLMVSGLNHAMHKIDPPGKKKGVNVSKSKSDAVKTANEVSSYGEAATEFVKEGLLTVREAMPLSSKIGTFKTFSKYFNYVKTAGNGIGLFSNAATGTSVLLDYNSYLNGDISGAVLTYRTVGNVATAGASYFSPVASVGVGTAFSIGEVWVNTMDYWTNVVNNANNLNWFYNAR